MSSETITVDESKLVELAVGAAHEMKKAIAGKPGDAVTQSTAKSLNAVAALLDALVRGVNDRRSDQSRLEAALSRIANLQVRSANELLEMGNWKKIAGELQAIAAEALDARKR